MTATIEALDSLDAALMPGAAAVAFGAFVCAFIAIARRPRPFLGLPASAVFGPCLAVFVVLIGMQLVITNLVVNGGRARVGRLLDAQIRSVVVDGEPLADPTPFVRALKSMDSVRPDHSLPVGSVRVQILTTEGSAQLRLGRDEKDPDNYWVFFEGLNLTRNNQIGHLHCGRIRGDCSQLAGISGDTIRN